MAFRPTTTTERFYEGTDETSIKVDHLTYTWRVEMKREKSIKKEESNERGDQKKREKNTVTPKTNFVIAPERNR